MNADWNTKYGTRRVRHDPPTLDEAIFAAVGITDDQEQQAEIAASLMGMPLDIVQAEVKKLARTNSRITATRVIAGEQGAQRSVVVERRVVRRFGNDKRRNRGQVDPNLAIARAKIEDAESFDEALSYLTARETFAVLGSSAALRILHAMPRGN